MQDKKLTAEDIAIPETVEVAIMQWWNSPASQAIREDADADSYMFTAISAVKVALLSLATNPIVPSQKDLDEWSTGWHAEGGNVKVPYWPWCIGNAQRRMFLRTPDPVPEEVKALMWVKSRPDLDGPIAVRHDADVIAAFKAGLEKRDAGN